MREKQFHDQAFADHRRAPLDRWYAVTKISDDYYWSILKDPRAQDVLEYGCGPGSKAFALAHAGRNVTGIDISDTAISIAVSEQEEQKIDNSVLTFRQMNAEQLEFDDESFDLVCGSAILHHLNLERAMTEIHRVLRPGGKACFLEPLGHNPAINLYRRVTPTLRTQDEHPLRRADLRFIRACFPTARFTFFHLLDLAVCSISKRTTRVHGLAARIDRFLLNRFPLLGSWAWITVIEASKKTT